MQEVEETEHLAGQLDALDRGVVDAGVDGGRGAGPVAELEARVAALSDGLPNACRGDWEGPARPTWG